jgi:hypothetical protein
MAIVKEQEQPGTNVRLVIFVVKNILGRKPGTGGRVRLCWQFAIIDSISLHAKHSVNER